MLFNYISLPIFLISFAIGLLFVYILGPETKTIYVYPTPENVDKILFKDKANNCYQYKAEKQDSCPKDKALVKPQPIIEDFEKQPNLIDSDSSNYYLL